MEFKMEEIQIDKNTFDWLREDVLKGEIKDTCKFCGVKVTRDNFGYIAKGTTCCNNFICLFEALKEEEKRANGSY
jgi:hypothetical protein